MISAAADDFNARVAGLERFLDELDRKTFSNLTVTNSTTGVKNLEIGPEAGAYVIRLRDDNANIIFGTGAGAGITGFRMPLPMNPAVPHANMFSTDATWLTTWQAVLFVNSPNIQGAYRYGDPEQGGGTVECRVLYDAGSGPVVIEESLASAVNPVNTVKQFDFTWPTNVFDTPISLTLQCRVAVAGAFDTHAVASPVYILGG